MESLQELLVKANNQIANVKEVPPIIIPPNYDKWRSKVHHILEEFQKFIDFALKTAPDQSRFLLPRESLLRFPDEDDSMKCID